MCVDDADSAGVGQGDLIWVIIANAHSVQVPEIGALGNPAALEVLPDLVINGLHEEVPNRIALLDALSRSCRTHMQAGHSQHTWQRSSSHLTTPHLLFLAQAAPCL